MNKNKNNNNYNKKNNNFDKNNYNHIKNYNSKNKKILTASATSPLETSFFLNNKTKSINSPNIIKKENFPFIKNTKLSNQPSIKNNSSVTGNQRFVTTNRIKSRSASDVRPLQIDEKKAFCFSSFPNKIKISNNKMRLQENFCFNKIYSSHHNLHSWNPLPLSQIPRNSSFSNLNYAFPKPSTTSILKKSTNQKSDYHPILNKSIQSFSKNNTKNNMTNFHNENGNKKVFFKNMVSVFRFESDGDSGCSSSDFDKTNLEENAKGISFSFTDDVEEEKKEEEEEEINKKKLSNLKEERISFKYFKPFDNRINSFLSNNKNNNSKNNNKNNNNNNNDNNNKNNNKNTIKHVYPLHHLQIQHYLSTSHPQYLYISDDDEFIEQEPEVKSIKDHVTGNLKTSPPQRISSPEINPTFTQFNSNFNKDEMPDGYYGYNVCIDMPKNHFDKMQDEREKEKENEEIKRKNEHQIDKLKPFLQSQLPPLPYSLYLKEVKNHQKIIQQKREALKVKPQTTFQYTPSTSNNNLVITVKLGKPIHPNDLLVKANKQGSKLKIVRSQESTRFDENLNEQILLPIQVNPYKLSAKVNPRGDLSIEAPIVRV